MLNTERQELIEQRLRQQFNPSFLQIVDDSAKHIGHAGSQNGAGHFSVTLSASCLQNLSKIAQHRLIYAALNDLIPQEIHALSIKVLK